MRRCNSMDASKGKRRGKEGDGLVKETKALGCRPLQDFDATPQSQI